MLSSAKITTQSWRYYVTHERCRAAEYFLGRDAELGTWLGRGLEPLGLKPGGAVRESQLEALFGRALHPETAVRLGRAWRSDGVTGYDLTFSAPKSVSALMEGVVGQSLTGTEDTVSSGQSPAGQQLSFDLQVPDGTYGSGAAPAGPDPRSPARPAGLGARDAVVAAHDTALRTALAYLDRHAGLSRRGTDGTEQISTDGFTVAAFTHYTSREGDPQLHTHALVLNKVRCADGTWRTLDGHELYAHKKSAGMIYQAVLRNELHTTLGVRFGEVSKDGQAEILGIPQALLEKWSKRAQHVNTEAAKAIAEFEATLGRSLTGDERAAVTKTAVLKTRPDKSHESQQSLAGRWTAEAAGLGIDLAGLLPAAQRAARASGPTPVRTSDELAGAALLAAGRSRAVFGRAEVAGQVAALLPTNGLSATGLLAQIESLTDRALALADAVEVGTAAHGATPRMSDTRFSTVEILSAEQRILELARTGQRAGAGQVGFDVIRQTLATVQPSGPAAGVQAGLDRSQVEALLHLLSHGDALDVLTAPAGAGKTATLGACAQAWHAAGYRVIGLAPSARAAAELQTAITGTDSPNRPPDAGVVAGSRTDTLAKWLHTRAQQPDLDALDPTRTDRAQRAGWARLDARTVLVIDEASMASTLDLDAVTRAAQAAGAKVVLVGDPGQIGVINGPGGMLAALARDGHAVALDTIHRFSQQWEKQASLALRDGTPDALQPYQQHQRLHPCPDGDSAADALFAHWQHATTSQGLDALMLARTRLDVDALNARARAAAHTDGRITGPVVTLGGRDWQNGDLLRTRKNARALPVGDGHVRNGDRYRVLGTSPDGGLIVEDLAGRGRTTLPAAYVTRHAEYGWAATIDGSQGATCDLGLLLARPGLDREHLYVALTRGRHGNHAYLTPDPTQAVDQHHPTGPGRPRDVEQLQRACLDILQAALTVSGAQDAAITALDRARSTATTPQPAGGQAFGADAAVIRRRPAEPDPTPSQLQLDQARAALARLQVERQHTRQTQRDLHRQRRQVTAALDGTPRWAAGRRRSHTQQLTELDTQQHAVTTRLAELDQQLDTTSQQIRTLQQNGAKATSPAAALPVMTRAGFPGPIPAAVAGQRPGRAPGGPDAARGIGRPDLPPSHPGRPRPGPDRGPDRGLDR